MIKIYNLIKTAIFFRIREESCVIVKFVDYIFQQFQQFQQSENMNKILVTKQFQSQNICSSCFRRFIKLFQHFPTEFQQVFNIFKHHVFGYVTRNNKIFQQTDVENLWRVNFG